jgi:hypothetical protein
MPCSFRLRTKTPDNKWEDFPVDDLLREEDITGTLDEFVTGELDGLIGFEGRPGTDTFSLKAKFKGFDGEVLDVAPEALLGDLEYTEIEREIEEVVVGEPPNTLTIERMNSVTFEGVDGGKLKLNFDNPPEGTP